MEKREIFYFTIILVFLLSLTKSDDTASNSPVINAIRFYPDRSFSSICYDSKRDNLLIFFSNKTFVLYHRESRGLNVLTRKILSLDAVKCIYSPALDLYILASSKGKLIFLDPESLRLVREENILLKGETVFTFEVTNDGKYLILGLKISYEGAAADRIAIISLQSFKRLYVWDFSTKSNKLVQLFFMRSYLNNLLIVEYLDKLCKICELTETRIAIFNVSATKILWEKAFGLSCLGVDDEKGKLIAVRYSQNPGDKTCPYIVLDMKSFTSFSSKIYGKIFSTAIKGDIAYFFYRTNDKDEVFVLEGKNLRTNKTTFKKIYRERGLLSFLGRYLVYATASKIRIFSGSKNIETITVENIIPPRYPDNIYRLKENVILIKYGNRLLYILEAKRFLRLTITLYTEQNKPPPNSTITVHLKNGSMIRIYTNNGSAILRVPPGKIKIEVSAKGYSYVEREMVITDNTNIKIYMSRSVIQRTPIVVTVLDETNKPICGALVGVVRENNTYYSGMTDEYGKVRFDAVEYGNYTLLIEKEGFYERKIRLNVDKSVINLTITLKRIVYNVTIRLPGNLSKSELEVSLMSVEDKELVYKGKSVGNTIIFTNVLPGTYEILLYSPRCIVENYNKTSRIIVNSNLNFSILISCINPNMTPSKVNPDVIIKIINESVQYSRKLNYELPYIVASEVDGEEVKISLNKSKVIILEFFYTRCEGCKYLIPVLRNIMSNESLQAEIYSLTVNPSDNEYLLTMYKKENNITWTVLKDSEKLYSRLNISTYPTVVVAYKGKLIFMGIGAKEEIYNLSKFKQIYRTLQKLSSILNLLYDNIHYVLILCSLILILIYKVCEGSDEKYYYELSLNKHGGSR